jgi:hypothetical protein
MEVIMQRIKQICMRGALALGAAALLLSGVPAHADPAAGAVSRESQPRLLAQTTTQPGEAEKLEQQRLKEQQERAKMEQQKGDQSHQKTRKMRGALPAPAAIPEAAPSKSSKSRFGAGVVRQSEKPVDTE